MSVRKVKTALITVCSLPHKQKQCVRNQNMRSCTVLMRAKMLQQVSVSTPKVLTPVGVRTAGSVVIVKPLPSATPAPGASNARMAARLPALPAAVTVPVPTASTETFAKIISTNARLRANRRATATANALIRLQLIVANATARITVGLFPNIHLLASWAKYHSPRAVPSQHYNALPEPLPSPPLHAIL